MIGQVADESDFGNADKSWGRGFRPGDYPHFPMAFSSFAAGTRLRLPHLPQCRLQKEFKFAMNNLVSARCFAVLSEVSASKNDDGVPPRFPEAQGALCGHGLRYFFRLVERKPWISGIFEIRKSAKSRHCLPRRRVPGMKAHTFPYADCKRKSTMNNRIVSIWCFEVLPEAEILLATRKFRRKFAPAPNSTRSFQDETPAVPSAGGYRNRRSHILPLPCLL